MKSAERDRTTCTSARPTWALEVLPGSRLSAFLAPLKRMISHRLAGFAAYKINQQRGPSAVDSPSGVESMGARVLLLESA